MKVLLFVQTGDARPKCVRAAKQSAAYAPHWHDPEVIFGDVPALDVCDRWWLVECENADAGRRVIAESVQDGDSACRGLRGNVEAGRILASGGKQEVKP